MAQYKFDRVSIMIVEDNNYIRKTLDELVRQFGFERIVILKNGQEAIENLQLMKQAGNPGPELIIADLVMAPINGLLLTRWCRSAKDSPNRMVPIIMLSGAADAQYVASARDLGATEFLAKPFSAGSVYRKILEVVDYPRQFVMTQSYFGPDRRRRSEGPPGDDERREKTEKDCNVVYSGDGSKKPSSASDVFLFRLQNALQEKCAGGRVNPNDRGELPTDILEAAENTLERAALDFTKWAQDYLGRLSDLCTQALLEPGRRTAQFVEINQVALELRGQGGTFGYPLISIFGKMLYDNTMEGCKEDDTQVEIVKAYIDSMRAVLREKISGDGGEVGKALIASLRDAVGKREAERKAKIEAMKEAAGGG